MDFEGTYLKMAECLVLLLGLFFIFAARAMCFFFGSLIQAASTALNCIQAASTALIVFIRRLYLIRRLQLP